ncbi:type II toxin-antitoxin system RelE/ParE family toxin [Phyllobacterium phragmitis]|uniref:Type II toxin-antitoxin system RelE/ParE family toxin n=1 Tax=Phyllobacterium phragmitis TaxID=2670329 RepID=A0A2S9IYZ4_9HYPH|nr:type II toxin-antitoxin system RelE/ParE family toxin [Phyllobacterium phragmitis]PRD45753.1 type II toxin-antitoxin system RelE/ParE family toxin [Phyllobacterium phragmitis]
MRPVIWAPEARADFLDILRYIAKDNPPAAERVGIQIEKVVQGLAARATGRLGRVSGTYEKSTPKLPYIIAYAIASNEGRECIAILRVIHTSRDWPNEDWPT